MIGDDSTSFSLPICKKSGLPKLEWLSNVVRIGQGHGQKVVKKCILAKILLFCFSVLASFTGIIRALVVPPSGERYVKDKSPGVLILKLTNLLF